ncbi:hypothetical protein [Thalassospira sp.]|uniref:hypothetical protein n=1 Tax=Thalassospira sp. TaxID=1912094 RepID=UPI002735308A|nr:hypothetical protein [Thalassospira sp.]MDP2699933.1 hypothetical protein [Thalassospira sp.]
MKNLIRGYFSQMMATLFRIAVWAGLSPFLLTRKSVLIFARNFGMAVIDLIDFVIWICSSFVQGLVLLIVMVPFLGLLIDPDQTFRILNQLSAASPTDIQARLIKVLTIYTSFFFIYIGTRLFIFGGISKPEKSLPLMVAGAAPTVQKGPEK